MPNKTPRVTPRELKILRHLADGCSENTISKYMNNLTGTIKNSLTIIRIKLEAFSTKPLNKLTNLAQFYREHLAPKPDSSDDEENAQYEPNKKYHYLSNSRIFDFCVKLMHSVGSYQKIIFGSV
jgi:DNA-binding CsgD family transcriptional regulator